MKAKRFPLPRVSRAADQFKKLCEAVPPSELPGLRRLLANCSRDVKRYEQVMIAPSIARASEIAERCHFLLESYGTRTRAEQALIVGVVKYFVLTADAVRDDTPLVGFDDDTMIVNFVLEELRIPDRFIE